MNATNMRHAANLAQAARAILTVAQRRAYERGKAAGQEGKPRNPPYGFTDLKDAWRRGYVAASSGKASHP